MTGIPNDVPAARPRADCVRDAVASVRIEGGEVDAATQALLASWANGTLTEAEVIRAIDDFYPNRG